MNAGMRSRLAIPMLVLAIVAVFFAAPLWSQDGDGAPVAIGFVTSDGETGLKHYNGIRRWTE